MGHHEMNNIRVLDTVLLNKHKERIWFYFGEKDGWVGDQREAVLRAVDADPECVRAVRGHADIPHAFCISELNNWSLLARGSILLFADYGEQVAAQCYEWLVFGGFI